MKNTLLLVQYFLFSILFFSLQSQASGILSSEKLSRLYKPVYSGTCELFDGEKIYLNEALFVKNEVVKQKTKLGYRLIKFVRDLVSIEEFDIKGQMIHSFRIDVVQRIEKENKKLSDIDIELSFIVINGELGVYWRQTFLHKPYFQGVFYFKENELSYLCQGSGGFHTTVE